MRHTSINIRTSSQQRQLVKATPTSTEGLGTVLADYPLLVVWSYPFISSLRYIALSSRIRSKINEHGKTPVAHVVEPAEAVAAEEMTAKMRR